MPTLSGVQRVYRRPKKTFILPPKYHTSVLHVIIKTTILFECYVKNYAT